MVIASWAPSSLHRATSDGRALISTRRTCFVAGPGSTFTGGSPSCGRRFVDALSLRKSATHALLLLEIEGLTDRTSASPMGDLSRTHVNEESAEIAPKKF